MNRNIINFDNSATTFPKPLEVRHAVSYAIREYGGNAGRGGHRLSQKTSSAVFGARENIADFFGAEPENVVFTLNCTHALNLAIQGIMSQGGHMIISELEHNSSARPAFELLKKDKIKLSVARVFQRTYSARYKSNSLHGCKQCYRSDSSVQRACKALQ